MIRLRVISLGAGVQSTTLALLAARRELGPMPDCAIFADTGWEPAAVYRHLEWLMSGVLPFPVHVVSAGNLKNDLLARNNKRHGRFVPVPFHLKQANGKQGIGRRQCTTNYKVEPIARKVRELLGVGPRSPIKPGSVEKWVGISLDEIMRAVPSKVRFEVKRFPLLELQMRRRDCLEWLKWNGYPQPPKSSCLGCPYHSNAMWRDLRDNPAEWAETVAIDHAIRDLIDTASVQKAGGKQYMHQQRVPLDEVDLSTAEDRGQLNLFINECEGMCGV